MSALHQGAREGNLAQVKLAVKGIYAEVLDGVGRRHLLGLKDAHQLTPLHYAVKYNHVDIARFLLDKGVDINVKGENGATPLHFATRYPRPEDDGSMLQLLMYSNVEVNARDDNQSTPLHYGCLKGNVKAVQQLLKSKDIDLQAVDKVKSTPLHSACVYGSVEIVQMLIAAGADMRAVDEGGMMPLHDACSCGNVEVVKYLIETMEDKFGVASVAQALSAENGEGQAPLHLAVLGSHRKLTAYLLERGCDVMQVMEADETVLHISATTGDVSITSLLLTHGAQVDARNMFGRTALHRAARFGKTPIVELLLTKRASVNATDSRRETPLLLACGRSGNQETVSLLLKRGADISMRGQEDRTALHSATLEDRKDAVQELLKRPDSQDIVNSVDIDGNTCLHLACRSGFEEIAIMLLNAGAQVHIRNIEERTPLHLAAVHGKVNVVDEIHGKNASTLNDFDREGNSPLHLAAKNGHVTVILELLKYGALINDRNLKSMTALDCAAEAGMTSAVEVLLWGGASVMPETLTGKTALHLAAQAGHPHTVEVLLKHCEIGATDDSGRNCLDVAIDYGKRDCAIAILNHRDWKVAMRNKTIEEDMVTTPMRKLIKKMPDVAKHAFNRCVDVDEKNDKDAPEFTVTIQYEFLDDVYNTWPCDAVRKDTDQGRGTGSLLTEEKIEMQLEKKSSHTLMVMVNCKREDLLSHPLARRLLERKWSHFAAYLYYSKLLLYLVFLLFLTGYILVSAPLRKPYRTDSCTITVDYRASWDLVVFVGVGRWIVLILAIVHMVFELLQIYGQRWSYFEGVDNVIEWIVYLLAVLNVADDFFKAPHAVSLVCSEYQKSVGAVAIFLSWINFLLFIRKVPVFGIFIVMFIYVLRTFFKFFVVFFFLIVAFGFSFFVLLNDIGHLHNFSNHWQAVVKTLVMMTGEVTFDELVNPNENKNPPAVAWVLFVLFILLLVIILMNLLVGLAVDDVQEVLRLASLTTAVMQIDICLSAERTLPRSLRKKMIAQDETLFPNKEGFFGQRKLVQEVLDAINEGKDDSDDDDGDVNDRTQKGISQLTEKVASLDEKVQSMTCFEEKLEEIKLILKDLTNRDEKKRKRREEKKVRTDRDSATARDDDPVA